MPSNGSVNDAVLQPFLKAKDLGESQRELLILLSEHAEPRMRSIIMIRLGSSLASKGRFSDYEDLCSEVKTRLVVYLQGLKENLTGVPCKDFLAYVGTVAQNACHDYFRQLYPARARLHRRLRDSLHTNPNFAIWKAREESTAEWICGFAAWQGRQSSNTPEWVAYFYENPERVIETFAEGGDIQMIGDDRLITSLFSNLGEPVKFSDLLDLVAEIRGIRDLPDASFDSDERSIGSSLSDPKLGIDSVLEMRECLRHAWQVLCDMPRADFKAYLLYARDPSGDSLINMFLHLETTTEEEVAGLFDMSAECLTDLLLHSLPLDNKRISKELGITIDRLYKRRYRANMRLKTVLSETTKKK